MLGYLSLNSVVYFRFDWNHHFYGLIVPALHCKRYLLIHVGGYIYFKLFKLFKLFKVIQYLYYFLITIFVLLDVYIILHCEMVIVDSQ
jgi:hypothetical protein